MEEENKNGYLLDTNICISLLKNKLIFPALELFGDIKTKLESEGNRIDDFDILIGSTAVKNNLIMVTDNIKHLERIPNIKIENWKY